MGCLRVSSCTHGCDSLLKHLLCAGREFSCWNRSLGRTLALTPFQDHTGYEAFVNAFHVEDYIDSDSERRDEDTSELMRQGGKAALELSKRLEIEGMYRVVLSFDNEFPAMTLLFFESREGEPWISEDLDEYPLEGILVIDTRC